jgi:hypothetical protein
MMGNTHRDNLIDRYLAGKLPQNELISFEERLQTDPLLVEEVALHARLVGLLKETGLRHFLGRVEQTFSRTSNLSPGLRFPEPPGSQVAAKVAHPKALPVYIAFEGESFFDQPILKIRCQKPRIKVKIYPPTEKYFFHYRISRTLTLYGDFETDQLTFISESYEGHHYYALRIGHLEYELGHYPVIRPLLEMEGSPARLV